MTLKISDNPPSCFPEDLFSRLLVATSPWWVARTRSRQEKSLAWELRNREMAYYLPLVSRPQKNRQRMRTSIVPLFNGYLFFRGSDQDRYEAIKTGRIAQVLPVADQERLHNELAALAQITATRLDLELCDFMVKGQRVQIVAGPFEGLVGIVVKQKNKQRLVLQIEAIRQAAAVEIELDQARPI